VNDAQNPALAIDHLIAGKYRLTGVLGIGGMAIVYEAIHIVTLRRVAVKLIHRDAIAGGELALERFLREARAPSSIAHPGIIETLDAGELPNGQLYLVLERLDGSDLESALATKQISVGELFAIAIEVLDALDAAHSCGFVHRDIKPANIFLADTRNGRRVKLLDFGIARQIDASTSRSIAGGDRIIGTLDYMSPEQAAGEVVDSRSDLWSLGALLFHGLAGRPPFAAPDIFQLVEQIVSGPLPSIAVERPNLPAVIAHVVDRALVRDRERRWQSAAAMRRAIARCLESEETSDLLAQCTGLTRPSGDPLETMRIRRSAERVPAFHMPADEQPTVDLDYP
jgi:eukaryotic-like serine/threonine-protein kinase